ncbi:hypothetical protein D3C71_2013230 [compost metagenome]
MATSLGKVFADAIEGVSQRDLAVPITPVRTIPFHPIARLVTPAMLGWYRLKDRLEPAYK